MTTTQANRSGSLNEHEKGDAADLHVPTHQVSMAPTFGSRQDPELKPKVGLRTWLAVTAASLAYFHSLYALVASAASARAASAALGGADISIFFPQVFPIAICVLGPPLGLLTDEIGRKNILVVSYALCIAGAFLTSEANSMGTGIAGRVLAAMSAAVVGIASSIPSECLPRAWRPNAQALFNVIGSFGGIAGALLSGYFPTTRSDAFGFRWTFRIEGILAAIVFVLLLTCYNPPPRPFDRDLTMRQKLGKVDLVSTFLIAAFIVPFIVALTIGGVTNPWSSANVLAPLILSCVMFIALVVYSIFVPTGLVHHDLFKRSRNYALALVGQGFEGVIFLMYNAFFPALASTGWSESGVILGARSALPFLGALVSGFLSTKYKDLRIWIVGGFALYTIAMIGLAAIPRSAAVGWFWGLLVGFGVGPLLVNLVVVAQLAAPAHLLALSTSLLLAVRAITGAIFTAIGTAVTNTQIAHRFPPAVIAASIQNGVNPATPASQQTFGAIIGLSAAYDAQGLAGVLAQAGVAPQQIPAAIGAIFSAKAGAFADSWRYIFIIAAPCAAVAAVVSLFFSVEDASRTMNYVLDAPAEEVHHAHGARDAEKV